MQLSHGTSFLLFHDRTGGLHATWIRTIGRSPCTSFSISLVKVWWFYLTERTNAGVHSSSAFRSAFLQASYWVWHRNMTVEHQLFGIQLETQCGAVERSCWQQTNTSESVRLSELIDYCYQHQVYTVNMWLRMSVKQRGQLIDKIVWKNDKGFSLNEVLSVLKKKQYATFSPLQQRGYHTEHVVKGSLFLSDTEKTWGQKHNTEIIRGQFKFLEVFIKSQARVKDQ